MNEKQPFPRFLSNLGNLGLGLGIIGLLGLAAAWASGGEDQFLHAYLYGWVFWTSMTIGCFGLMLLQNIVRASWGWSVIRLFEAGAKMAPIVGLGVIPIVLGAYAGHLYPWADPTQVAHSEVLQHRAAYMNPLYFAGRSFLYFLFFTIITWWLTSLSREQDRTGNLKLVQNRVNIASPSFLVMVLGVTFAITDWVMSLDPQWYSTIYGFWFLICSALSAMSFVTLIGCYLCLAGDPNYKHVANLDGHGNRVTRDWGNLLLMMTMVWAYFSLSQFLITWSGNLPMEITYYIKRNFNELAWVSAVIVTFQFFVPFLCLLSSRAKRTPNLLMSIVVLILCVRVLEVAWNVIPMFHPTYDGLAEQLEGWPFYIAGFLGIGGIWLYGFVFNARRGGSLIPVSDLAPAEVLHHAS